MKIFHVIELRHSTLSGVYYAVMPLCKEQRALGHSVSVYNLVEWGYSDETIKNITPRLLSEQIKLDCPDVVILHCTYPYQSYPIYRILKKHGVPYFIQMHGALSLQNLQKNKLKKWIARKVYIDRIVRDAQTLIYLNKQEYSNSGVRKVNPKALIIPNGCYMPEWTSVEAAHSIGKTVELIFLSRIFRDKGLGPLVDAIKILRSKMGSDAFHISFYGTGPDVEWFEGLIKSIDDVATFHGPVYGDKKVDAYLQSNIMVLPSFGEGFPMSVIESLSLGVPCVVTPMTNVSDIIDKYDCGWTSTLDPQDLADTLQSAIEDYCTRPMELIKNSYMAAKNYEWCEVAKLSIEKYQYTLQRKIN